MNIIIYEFYGFKKIYFDYYILYKRNYEYCDYNTKCYNI